MEEEKNQNQQGEQSISSAEQIKREAEKGSFIENVQKDKVRIGRIVFMGIVFLMFVGLLIAVAFIRQIFGDEIGDLILGEGVENGFVAMGMWVASSVPAVIMTAVIVVFAIVIYFILNVIIRLTFNKNQKSKTIGSLVKSCVKYVTILVAVALVLTAWGVDVASVVAGLGVLTLIIGLGCQTLIQDIVSGLFIVFDDYFSVGDLVIVDGFRGTVTSIGLKTTKITDPSGNIKSITNSSITTVVNISRLPTMVCVEFDIGFNEDLKRVEGIIAKNLDRITKHIPQITEGLYYKGVSKFTAAGVSLLFLCYCLEGDRFQVDRDIKREIYLMCRANDITVPFNQITVNPEDSQNRPTASDEEKKGANKLNDLNHPMPVIRKKKKFRDMVTDSLKAELKDIEN
ncbi:MAG: mechanosensitive ion channel family protein [Bacilli bacterium]|nr:mechanosensitive ion channel family protein [Bacilli bacterium]